MIREIAATDWFDGKFICRGVAFSLNFKKKHFPILDKINKGTAKPEEIWPLLDHKGHAGYHWWRMDKKDTEEGINSWDNPDSYAYTEDTLDSNWGKVMRERVATGDIPDATIGLAVVLVAKMPKDLKLSDWDSSIENNIKSVELVAIRYYSPEKKWVMKPFKQTIRL